jgi:RND family efflux transporter MFP subunit
MGTIMNNKLLIINKNSVIHPFQSLSDFLKANWHKISAVLAIGFGIMANFVFTQSTGAIPLTSYESPLLTVQTSAMNRVNQYTLKRTFIGRVEATRNTDLGFELAGKITRILVDEGTQVAKGQVLAYLDTDRLQAKKNELLSALSQTRANLKLADITYRRHQKIVHASAVSKQQLDETKENFMATQAAVELARSRIKSIEVEIDKSTLHAPFDANIINRKVDEGQVVAAGSPLLRLQEGGSSEVRVGIAGLIVDSIQVGQDIPVDVGELSIRASVKAIVKVRDGRSRTVDVILSLQKPPAQIRAGDLARIELTMKVDVVGYWVPISALSEDVRGIWSIYTLEPVSSQGNSVHQLVHRRTIEIIHAESERVFVQGYFENDDLVITDGLQRIVPDQLVQVSTSLAYANNNLTKTDVE